MSFNPRDSDDRHRAHRAALRAQFVYPGPVGRLIQREIDVWIELGFRTDQTSPVPELVEHILAAKVVAA